MSCEIFVDALPEGRVHIGICDIWTCDQGDEHTTTSSINVSASEAEQLATLLLMRAASSREPT